MFFSQNFQTLLNPYQSPIYRGGEHTSWYLRAQRLLIHTLQLTQTVSTRLLPNAQVRASKITPITKRVRWLAPTRLKRNTFHLAVRWLRKALRSRRRRRLPTFSLKLKWYQVLTNYWAQKRILKRRYRTRTSVKYADVLRKNANTEAQLQYFLHPLEQSYGAGRGPRTFFTNFWNKLRTSEFEDLVTRNITGREPGGYYNNNLYSWVKGVKNKLTPNFRHEFTAFTKGRSSLERVESLDPRPMPATKRAIYGKLHEVSLDAENKHLYSPIYSYQSRTMTKEVELTTAMSLLTAATKTKNNLTKIRTYKVVNTYQARHILKSQKHSKVGGLEPKTVNRFRKRRRVRRLRKRRFFLRRRSRRRRKTVTWQKLRAVQKLGESAALVQTAINLERQVRELNTSYEYGEDTELQDTDSELGSEEDEGSLPQFVDVVNSYNPVDVEDLVNWYGTAKLEVSTKKKGDRASTRQNVYEHTPASGWYDQRDCLDFRNILGWRYLPKIRRWGFFQKPRFRVVRRWRFNKKPEPKKHIKPLIHYKRHPRSQRFQQPGIANRLFAKVLNPYTQVRVMAKTRRLYANYNWGIGERTPKATMWLSLRDAEKCKKEIRRVQAWAQRRLLGVLKSEQLPVTLGDFIAFSMAGLQQRNHALFNRYARLFRPYKQLKKKKTFRFRGTYVTKTRPNTIGRLKNTTLRHNRRYHASKSLIQPCLNLQYYDDSLLWRRKKKPRAKLKKHKGYVRFTTQLTHALNPTHAKFVKSNLCPLATVFRVGIDSRRLRVRLGKLLTKLPSVLTPKTKKQKVPLTRSLKGCTAKPTHRELVAGNWLQGLMNVVYEPKVIARNSIFTPLEQVKWAKRVLVNNTKLALKNYKLTYKTFESFGYTIVTIYDKIQAILKRLPRFMQKNLHTTAFSLALFRLLVFKEVNEWADHLKHWYQKHNYKKHKRIFYTLRRVFSGIYKTALHNARFTGLFFQLKGKVGAKGGLRKRLFRAFYGRFGSSTLKTTFQYKFKQVWCRSGAIGLKVITMHRNTQHVPKEAVSNRISGGRAKYRELCLS